MNIDMYNFIDSISVPVFFKDTKRIYRECNNAFSQFIGRSKNKIIGKTVYEIAPEELANVYNNMDDDLFQKQNSPQIYGGKVLHQDGDVHDVIFFRELLRDKDGSVCGVVGVIFDVTESKKKEEQLRKSEQLYRYLVEQSSDGILIFQSDTGRIEEANKQFCTMIDYSSEELHQMSIYNLIDGDKETFRFDLYKAIKYSRAFVGFQKCRRKDGTCLIAEVSLAQVYVDSKYLIMASVRDVTELKKIEAERYRQELFLRTITETSPLGYLVVNNLTDEIMYVNSKFCEIWQIKHLEEDIRKGKLTNTDIMLYYLALVVNVSEFIESSKPLQGKNNQITVEDEILLMDGRIIRRYSAQIRDKNDNNYGRFYMFEDITQRRQIEFDLSESEAKYRELFSNSPAVKLIIDPETGTIADANQTAANYYGYTIDELRNMKINDINIAKSQEIYNKIRTFDHSTNGCCFLFKHRLRSGEVRDVEVYSGQTYINKKKLINSIVIDVTARQQVEEELHLHRERLSFVVEGARAGIWDWDLVSGDIYYDKQWKAILGYEDHEISNSVEEWNKRRHPEDVDRINQVMQDYLAGNTEKHINEYRLRHKNGEYRWLLSSGKITRDKTGTPLRWAGSIIDITDRKRGEELLLESKARLVNFAQAIPDTSFIMDEDGRYVEIFRDYDVWLNKSKEELHGRTIHEVMHNDSADSLLKQVRLTIMSGENQCIANECYRLGIKRFFEMHTAPMHYLANGKETVAVIVNDITERRNTENMLQLSYELRRRSDFFNDIINDKVIFNENLAVSAKEMGIDVFTPLICCLLTSGIFVKQETTYNNDSQILKSNLIDFLKAEPNYVIWDCRDYIGILYQSRNQDNVNTLSGTELAYKLKRKIHSHFPHLTIMIGISNVQKGLNSIREAYKQAISAMKSIRCQCENKEGIHCCYYGDLGIFQLLTYYNEDHATKFIEEKIGRLIKYDKEKGTDLLTTLENILQSVSLKDVAEKMFFHYKTIVLRKRRIEKILGISVNSFETRVTLDAAIKLYKLQKNR